MAGYEYERPDFLDGITEDSIHQEMLDVIPGDIDKTEGGFIWDATRAAAIQLAQAYYAMDMVVQLIFPMYSYSGWADLHGLTRGIVRKGATPSTGKVTAKGVPGTIIKAGFEFATTSVDNQPNVIFATDEEKVIPEDDDGDGLGVVELDVTCTTPGYDGNVPANSIIMMVDPAIRLTDIMNTVETMGGVDPESDDDLVDRIVAHDIDSEVSYVGSEADYRRWAMSVDGVGGVTVIPEYNGPGTTKIVVVDENNKPANEDIINAVIDYILAPNDPDKRLAPVDALGRIVITAPQSKVITIEADVKLEKGCTVEMVTTQLNAALSTYFNEAAKDGVVRFNRIGSILIELDSVADYDDLLVNGDVENIVLQADEYPTQGTITVVSYI